MPNDKEFELATDAVLMNQHSVCCDAPVYAPTDEWARCLICLEMCDIITEE